LGDVAAGIYGPWLHGLPPQREESNVRSDLIVRPSNKPKGPPRGGLFFGRFLEAVAMSLE
jgi:hypothetical protein